MKIYNTQAEIDADIVDGVLRVKDDVSITFDCVINGDLYCRNLKAGCIKVLNIDAGNIDARNINAENIYAYNITAGDINYYAVCFVYKNITCTSIKGRRENAKHFCLDGKITIIEKETIEIEGKKYLKSEVEEKLKELKPVN